MIRSLHIEHYALIDKLDIELKRGFSVITGETGAGKSIILGATQLLLGGRADHGAIRAGEKRCVIEAEFDLSGMDLTTFFDDNDLDFDETSCILRRELTAAGKSRAFINDSPVSLTLMKQLGDKLIDIHSQHQNLLLGTEDYQLGTLDTIARNHAEVETYTRLYAAYRDACKQYEQAVDECQRIRGEEDYLRFQVEGLADAHLTDGEQEELEAEQEMLSHAEDIKTALYRAGGLMDGDDDGVGVMEWLRMAQNELESIEAHHRQVAELVQRMDSCRVELQDITDEVASLTEGFDFDPARLGAVEERLDTIYTLEKKHHATTIAELLNLLADMEHRLSLIDQSDDHLEHLKAQRTEAYSALMAQADVLTESRKKAKGMVETKITDMLHTLGMPYATFSIDMTRRDEPDTKGMDKVTFMFSANKNIPPRVLTTVASGGEMARVMLSLKALTSEARQLPTIIFDEIDTGVSGSIAEMMATIMQGMASAGQQVISITHLPQIAARGTEHYKVYKDDGRDQTTTHIAHLTTDQRIDEVAHMLSGATLTQAAINNAKELLKI